MLDNNLFNVFIKPIAGMKGRGCYRIQLDDLIDIEKINKIYEVLIKGHSIIQEVIVQHDDINKINPYSINTIRMDTYINEEGHVEVLSALMRFGRKGSVVDNTASGGFIIYLDLETGRLGKYGMHFLDISNKTVYHHPDTKTKLDNFQIPLVSESVELVKYAALALGDNLVGWDVGLTPDGPILIEGNHNYGLNMQEMTYGGYNKHPIFQDILKRYVYTD